MTRINSKFQRTWNGAAYCKVKYLRSYLRKKSFFKIHFKINVYGNNTPLSCRAKIQFSSAVENKMKIKRINIMTSIIIIDRINFESA